MTRTKHGPMTAGATIGYTIVDSALGGVLVAATDHGVRAVLFGEPGTLSADLAAEFPDAVLERRDEALGELATTVADAARGHQAGPGVPLDLVGTDFQRRVWAELQRIPAGETATYAEIAARIGRPTATRAVAGACAANHAAIVVPCHRVVRSDGGLGGYRWGIERKKALLTSEGVGRAE